MDKPPKPFLKVLKWAWAMPSALLWVAGMILGARDITAIGLPPVAWQLIGGLLFMGTVVFLVYRLEKRLSDSEAGRQRETITGMPLESIADFVNKTQAPLLDAMKREERPHEARSVAQESILESKKADLRRKLTNIIGDMYVLFSRANSLNWRVQKDSKEIMVLKEGLSRILQEYRQTHAPRMMALMDDIRGTELATVQVHEFLDDPDVLRKLERTIAKIGTRLERLSQRT